MKVSDAPDAVITIDGNQYALYSKREKINPHMVELSSGEIPFGEQRSLLKRFLLDHGADIEPWKKKNTHWCIGEAIKISR